jgi:hypothetical protein
MLAITLLILLLTFTHVNYVCACRYCLILVFVKGWNRKTGSIPVRATNPIESMVLRFFGCFEALLTTNTYCNRKAF